MNKTLLITAGLLAMAAPVLAQHQGHVMPPPAGQAPPAATQAPPAMPGGMGMHQMHRNMMGMGQGGGQHTMSALPEGDNGPSSLAYHGANLKMHKDMTFAFTGDADVDFIKGMIPHHQGAIDMAKIVLAFGKDAQTRKLAEEIIKAQETEIAMMKEWLAKRGK